MGLFASDARSPHLSAEQLKASRASYPAVPAVCVVTGGTGFVGARLVEMLVERGAKTVRVLDVVPPGPLCWKDPRIEYTVGSICDEQIVAKVVDGADCVWHMAAAVGPFHPTDLYKQVNYEGTKTIVNACRAKKVRKIVMSSSPSTRFDGSDVDGLTEAQMPSLPQKRLPQTGRKSPAWRVPRRRAMSRPAGSRGSGGSCSEHSLLSSQPPSPSSACAREAEPSPWHARPQVPSGVRGDEGDGRDLLHGGVPGARAADGRGRAAPGVRAARQPLPAQPARDGGHRPAAHLRQRAQPQCAGVRAQPRDRRMHDPRPTDRRSHLRAAWRRSLLHAQ